MTRPRQLVVLVLAAALVASACEAFEATPRSSAGPGATSAASAPTASGSVTTVAIADFGRSADGSIVRVVGLVRSRSGTFIELDGHDPITLEDPTDPSLQITAWIPVSEADPPAPNTMARLGSLYTGSDLLLMTENGTTIREGDAVAVTGTVHNPADGNPHLDRVIRIEVAEETGEPGTPEPGETPTPAPQTVTIADFDKAADGAIVRVVGLIQAPGSTSTIDGHGSLHLQDPANPEGEITVWVPIGSGTPPPANTMGDLPSGYKATDLVLSAEDGTAIHHGDAVALTGTVVQRAGASSYLDYVTRIEVAEAPLPKPVAVSFKTIKKQKAGTLVKLTGRLDVGFLTSCFETCGIYLEDPASGATVSIHVTLGAKGERVPNTMWPLPSNYSRSSLRVIANDGRLLKGGARVRVTGWIEVGTDKKRRIDPVIRIDYMP